MGRRQNQESAQLLRSEVVAEWIRGGLVIHQSRSYSDPDMGLATVRQDYIIHAPQRVIRAALRKILPR